MLITEQEIEAGWEVVEGWVIDGAGEVVRLAQKPPFRPETRDGANWVLGKMGECEGDLVAIERRRKAIMVNLDAQARKAQARLDWLHRRYDNDLAELAKRELAGGKGKTLVLDHGRISFRTSKGTNRITDMERAVNFAEMFLDSSIVKTVRSVAVSQLMPELDRFMKDVKADYDPDDMDGTAPEAYRDRVALFLESSGPRETIHVSPGVAEG